MDGTPDGRSEAAAEAKPAPAEAAPPEAKNRTTAVTADAPPHTDQHASKATSAPADTSPKPAEAKSPSHPWRKWLLLAIGVVVLGAAAWFLIPWISTVLNTVSTDDAYVNGHVTFVAPRVAGQVEKVWVDDNKRVKKGDVLVELDPEPYLIQVRIKRAAVETAETNLKAAYATVRGLVAQTRSNRYKLEHAMEDVRNQIANLKAYVAVYESKKATLALAQANLKRGLKLIKSRGISKEELDQRTQAVAVAEAAVKQALETVHATRVGLGLAAEPGQGLPLTEVPPNLDENFSTVRQALGDLLNTVAQLGYFPTTWDASPKQAKAAFYRQDEQGNLDRIYDRLISKAPLVRQAKAKLLQARRDLDEAMLNLRYCKVVSEIDGVVTRRNVNPGNNVQVGQSLMAVRSLSEIWIDANFKETQLADLRIGQPVRIEVDMYGGRREFQGYISGFTFGTGQTLALLPPQNATGNFVKIVQRLPVRIELLDYKPGKAPLFAGLSAVPYVYFKKPLVKEDPKAVRALAASTVGLLGSPLGQGPILAASALVPGRTDIPGRGQKLQTLGSLPTAPLLPRP
jgi:membrane fusion protein (multidrug efflux system)